MTSTIWSLSVLSAEKNPDKNDEAARLTRAFGHKAVFFLCVCVISLSLGQMNTSRLLQLINKVCDFSLGYPLSTSLISRFPFPFPFLPVMAGEGPKHLNGLLWMKWIETELIGMHEQLP